MTTRLVLRTMSTDASHNPYPVKPAGLLFGTYLASALYGVHLVQFRNYITLYPRDTLRLKTLVAWIWILSTLQMIIIWGSGWQYFVNGIGNESVWGEFLWPLRFQNGLIPVMACTAQLFFGRRAWLLLGRRRWMGWVFVVLPLITLASGLGLAITAKIWAESPWMSTLDWYAHTQNIGVLSQIVAVLWMGLSAFTDGLITICLLLRLKASTTDSNRSMINRLVSLTLETILLTHICGATMCVIFLVRPAAHRTDLDIFWVLIEVITELYALSMLFTINSRRLVRRENASVMLTEDMPSRGAEEGEQKRGDYGLSEIERRVEGYQGDTPFGVVPSPRGAAYELSTMSGSGEGMMVSTSGGSGYEAVVESSGLETPGLELGVVVLEMNSLSGSSRYRRKSSEGEGGRNRQRIESETVK